MLAAGRKPLNSCRHPVEDLYIEENLVDQSIDNVSSPDRIKWAINSCKPFKSSGPDGFIPQ